MKSRARRGFFCNLAIACCLNAKGSRIAKGRYTRRYCKTPRPRPISAA